MKKSFVSLSFKNRELLRPVVETIKSTLKEYKIEPVVFVEKYCFAKGQEKEMMKKAFEEIKNCDFFIAEVSTKEIGIGIEVGYAKALGKPIIYARNISSEISATVEGSTEYSVFYEDVEDLRSKLSKIIEKIR